MVGARLGYIDGSRVGLDLRACALGRARSSARLGGARSCCARVRGGSYVGKVVGARVGSSDGMRVGSSVGTYKQLQISVDARASINIREQACEGLLV